MEDYFLISPFKCYEGYIVVSSETDNQSNVETTEPIIMFLPFGLNRLKYKDIPSKQNI